MVEQLDGGIMRREVYKKVRMGQEDLWDDYSRLHGEVKELVEEAYHVE